eukprot:TRINITY_DN9438_c1_g1_i1.p1 TRINITY_DN9438_c1_g1~~TRINITY_DN9438_c1_g1_i1.p1  ORF type:complete len:461 (+),score=39.66 TRINITY_DN9438_c1_g1_i1:46-1428(+)
MEAARPLLTPHGKPSRTEPVDSATAPLGADADGPGGIERRVKQAKPSAREQAFWMLLGTGCTWFLGDAVFLQTAWWVNSQPEGDELGATTAFVSSLATSSVALCILLRARFPKSFVNLVVPTMIALSLLAGYMLGVGLWSVSTMFIYASVFLAQSVGILVPFSVVTWVLQKGFNPVLISSLYFGGSLCSLSASVVSWVQQPGGDRLFSPSVFFLIITTPVLGSIFAYICIDRQRIGAVTTDQVKAKAGFSQMFLGNIGHWWRSALLFALVVNIMGLGSWNILRAALPYAATNTVIGHNACTPHCQTTCSSLTTASGCNVVSACEWSFDKCIVNKGTDYLQWAQSIAQWAYAAGTGCSVLFPTTRLWMFPLLWICPLGMVCAMAFMRGNLWEFPSAGGLLILFTCLTRVCQGYFEASQFRYVATQYKEDAEAVTVFVGVVGLFLGFFGGSASSALIEAWVH